MTHLQRSLPAWAGILAALACACGHPVHNDQSTEAGSTAVTGAGTTHATTTTVAVTTTTSATTTPATTAGSTTCDDPAPTTDCGIVCPDDTGDLLPYSCNPLEQDCPGCGAYKCAAYDWDKTGSWNATGCVKVQGDGVHGDPCTAEPDKTGVDDCAFGHMCWYLDERGSGTCVAQCTGRQSDQDCSHAPGTECQTSDAGVLYLCLGLCHPLLQDCGANQVCVYVGGEFKCTTATADGPAPAGTPCEFTSACDPGLVCINHAIANYGSCEGALSCCTPYCDLDEGDAPCQAEHPDFVCVPHFDEGETPLGYENIGFCGLLP